MKTWPKAKLEKPSVSEKFKKWVRAFGPSRLANSLEKNKPVIYSWIARDPHHRVPRLVDALQIVALSKYFPSKVGQLSMADLGWKIKLNGLTVIETEIGKPDKRFYDWMKMMGKPALMASLAMSKSRVGQLMNGGRPSHERAQRIIRLSKEYPIKGGPLTLSEVRGQVYSEQKNLRL